MPGRVRIRGPGDRNLRGMNKQIGALTRAVAVSVAKRGAREITLRAQRSLKSGQTCYNRPRPLGVHGNTLTLYHTGTTARHLRFASYGTTQIRAVLPERYHKYLIGKYEILPIGSARMPEAWLRALDLLVRQYMDREVPKELKRAA